MSAQSFPFRDAVFRFHDEKCFIIPANANNPLPESSSCATAFALSREFYSDGAAPSLITLKIGERQKEDHRSQSLQSFYREEQIKELGKVDSSTPEDFLFNVHQS